MASLSLPVPKEEQDFYTLPLEWGSYGWTSSIGIIWILFEMHILGPLLRPAESEPGAGSGICI